MGLIGAACELVGAYLMSAKKIHFLWFAVLIYMVSGLFNVMTSGDLLIIGLETFLIIVVPKVCSFFAVSMFWALPFRIPLRWWRPMHGRSPMASPAPPASATGSKWD